VVVACEAREPSGSTCFRSHITCKEVLHATFKLRRAQARGSINSIGSIGSCSGFLITCTLVFLFLAYPEVPIATGLSTLYSI